MKPNPFPQLLHAFFHDWLVQQRNVSHHTVLSYRDSWRLFLRFVAAPSARGRIDPPLLSKSGPGGL
jgi:integrase/recombinase XerC